MPLECRVTPTLNSDPCGMVSTCGCSRLGVEGPPCQGSCFALAAGHPRSCHSFSDQPGSMEAVPPSMALLAQVLQAALW